MGQANFNIEDPAQQEAIRRKPHQYIPTAGKHGAYVPLDPRHNRPENVAPYQEYPKMMHTEKTCPKPVFQNFKRVKGVEIPGDIALANFQNAIKEWDDIMTRSIVHNEEQEAEWKRANG